MMNEKAKKILNVIPQIIANVTIVLSAVYILFYILDGYNPMLHFLGEQVFLTRYLDIIIAGLGLLLGILFAPGSCMLSPGKRKRARTDPHSFRATYKQPLPV